jgi:hypothetical protein
MNAWIGKNWTNQRKKLILGESWPAPEESLHRYVRRWCAGAQSDFFITRIFNACSGYQAATATPQQRLGFWEQLAFTNFVYWSVGSTNRSKVTTAHFVEAQPDLDVFLRAIQPDVVWIIGHSHAPCSKPCIAALGIKYVISKHPRAGVSSAQLLAAYRSL